MKLFKKVFFYLFLFALILSSPVIIPNTSGMHKAEAATKKISLSKTTVNLIKGKDTTITLKNAKAKDVKWSSGNKKIATVSKKGKITAKKPGKTKITATYNNKKYKCVVCVRTKKLKCSKTNVVLNMDKSTKVTVTLKLYETISYDIEDSNVVSCSWGKNWDGNDIKLTIKAKNPGTTRVYIHSKESKLYQAITVKVKAPWENVKVVIPETIGEKYHESNRMKITKYQFYDLLYSSYKMKISFKSVKIGDPSSSLWEGDVEFYDKNGNLIDDDFYFSGKLKLGTTYTDTIRVPIETRKIVFCEYPEYIEEDNEEDPDSGEENDPDDGLWSYSDINQLYNYVAKANEYADKAYTDAAKGTEYEPIALNYVEMAKTQLQYAAAMFDNHIDIKATDGSDYLSAAVIGETIACCDEILNGEYTRLSSACGNLRVETSQLLVCVSNAKSQF